MSRALKISKMCIMRQQKPMTIAKDKLEKLHIDI